MRKSWLLCVLLGTMAWAQVQPSPAPAPPSSAQAPSGGSTPPAPAAEVPETAVVLTIDGVCPASPKAATTPKTSTAAKSAAAKKPADCKTKITRAEFEKIAKGVSPTPNVSPQLKRQLAAALPKFMAMSEAAKAKGLDQSEAYKETLKVAKMQILTTQLQRSV
jgi:hypothetical protein